MFWPCETSTSTCLSLATISSGLNLLLGISVLLDAKRHNLKRTTSTRADQEHEFICAHASVPRRSTALILGFFGKVCQHFSDFIFQRAKKSSFHYQIDLGKLGVPRVNANTKKRPLYLQNNRLYINEFKFGGFGHLRPPTPSMLPANLCKKRSRTPYTIN